jgi:hypothetical protein
MTNEEARIRELAAHMAGYQQGMLKTNLARLEDMPVADREQWLARAAGIEGESHPKT